MTVRPTPAPHRHDSDAPSPPAGMHGLPAHWSRRVPVVDAAGVQHTWHVLDNGQPATRGTLLCVHGNPTWSYLWRRLVAGAPPGWRVLAPDQLGMGWSERLDSPRTLAQRVSDLDRLTTELRLEGPVVVVAHDWGGPISLGWALRNPDLLRGLVLFNTAVSQPPGSAGPALIRLARMRGVRDLACVRSPTFVRSATALSRPPLARAVRDAFAAPYSTAARRAAVGDFVADIPFETDHPSRSTLDGIAHDLPKLDVPTLLLWGPRDPVFGQDHLDDLRARIPQAQLHRYERASHLVPEDAPEYVDAVGAWLADLDDEARRDATGSSDPAQAPRSAVLDRLYDRAGDPGPAIADVGRTTVSWDLLGRRVDELAAGLALLGVRPGARVALLVPPSAELTAAAYEVWRAGGTVVVVDRGLGLRGMGRALRSAGVELVLGTAAGLAAARAMRLPGQRVVVGPVAPAARAMLGADVALADLARRGRAGPLPAGPSVDDECAVLFTSGATGPAKGVVYRHHQLQAQVDLLRAAYRLGREDRIVAAFAPFSLYGPALGIGSVVPDMDVTAPGTLTAAALADAVAAIGGSVVFASPAALRGVLATPGGLTARHRAALGGVRLLISAGAPVPSRLLRSLREVLPAAELHTPYGMTEALPVTDISLPGIEAAGDGDGVCVGRPLPGVDVAVSPLTPAGEPDLPLTAQPAGTGEVCVRGPHIKDRYDALWATERASARDAGWHRTGDVGHLDAEGRVWIEGRLQHLVRTATGVVTPVGVEQRVEALEAVAAAATVGVGPRGSQQVAVVVVPRVPPTRRDGALAPAALADEVRSVAGVPVAAVLVRRDLPVDLRHASKVDRAAVASWAERILAGSRD